MITTADFRYVDSPNYFQFTLEQTKDMMRTLWPEDAEEILQRLERDNRA